MDLNRATIIGNVTRDPELKNLPSGSAVCSISVATNINWTGKDGEKTNRTEFHNVVFWGKQAELASQYLSKGEKVYVEGRLQTREWEAKDGTKKQRTEINADNFIMLSPKRQQFSEPLITNEPNPMDNIPF